MEKIESDAEHDALIADLTGVIGKIGEEGAAGQLADAFARPGILNGVRAYLHLMDRENERAWLRM
jgi:hypothetical protein